MKTTKVNILIVDDDKNIRTYVAKILSVKSWNVDTAADGPMALALARNRFYDVVVLDYRMPGMNGVEVGKRIKEMHSEARVVFLSGYATHEMIASAFDVRADRVLAKPVNPKELIHVLEKQLESPAPPE